MYDKDRILRCQRAAYGRGYWNGGDKKVGVYFKRERGEEDNGNFEREVKRQREGIAMVGSGGWEHFTASLNT